VQRAYKISASFSRCGSFKAKTERFPDLFTKLFAASEKLSGMVFSLVLMVIQFNFSCSLYDVLLVLVQFVPFEVP
jgi:multisubunit Na+/H+ antiporter MnhG subunit